MLSLGWTNYSLFPLALPVPAITVSVSKLASSIQGISLYHTNTFCGLYLSIAQQLHILVIWEHTDVVMQLWNRNQATDVVSDIAEYIFKMK